MFSERATANLHYIQRMFPFLDQAVLKRIKAFGSQPPWPHDVVLPFAEWKQLLTGMLPDLPFLEKAMLAERAVAVGTWQFTRCVYRFEPLLMSALSATRLPDIIPLRVLRHLPDPCPYIILDSFTPLRGMYCYLDFNTSKGAWELRVYLDDISHNHSCIRIELTEGLTIREAVDPSVRRVIADASIPETLRESLLKSVSVLDISGALTHLAYLVLPLILYLCQPYPDIEDKNGVPVAPLRSRSSLVDSLHLTGTVEDDKPVVYNVGRQMAPKIASLVEKKKAQSSLEVHPSYWIPHKSRYGDRELEYLWVPPEERSVRPL
ncbi:MAG: hypothetical protein LBD25_06080 [Coriobacteriales bacterium]|jgi:hypothetical protein|nr:hypothetical protein [Coriobacteriales bacterium]